MERFWDGRAIHVQLTDPQIDRRTVEVALTPEAAEALRLYLSKGSLSFIFGPPEVKEIWDSLEYVLSDSEAGRTALNRIQAGRGMTPDGGYRAPDSTQHPLPTRSEARTRLPRPSVPQGEGGNVNG